MLMDIGASFVKWQLGNEYREEPFDNHIDQIWTKIITEPTYIACQANTYVDPNGHIHNWGYEPNQDDIALIQWLKKYPNVKYVGYDYELAILGADLHEGEVLVNMGTGGQVTILGKQRYGERLTIEGKDYTSIRFIPCGKILTHLNNMFDIDVYTRLASVSLEDLGNTHGLNCDPAWDSKHWNYPGSFCGITLENFTIENMVKAVFNGILRRFLNAVDELDHHSDISHITTIKVAGGIAEKFPIVKTFFQQYYQSVEIIEHATFKGLDKIKETH